MPPVQRVPESAEAAAPPPSDPAANSSPANTSQAGVADSVPAYDTSRATISADVITVTVTDPLPVRAARLVAPDGIALEAAAIDTERYTAHEDNGTRPRIGATVLGGSSGGVSTGVGIGFPLFGSGETRTWRETQSRITFRLPDPAAYRADWQRYSIAVDLDDGVNRRSFQMLPPAPPTE